MQWINSAQYSTVLLEVLAIKLENGFETSSKDSRKSLQITKFIKFVFVICFAVLMSFMKKGYVFVFACGVKQLII